MKKLTRSSYGALGGVCKGISEFTDIDATIIRLMFVVLIFTPFPSIIAYLICWAIIPKKYYD
jgi:phage shock protein C